MPHKHGQLHDGSTVVERVKQTTFFVTHIATNLITEVRQLAKSINLSCHITSTPRLVLLQSSNLSRIFTTTHTLLKQSSIRNNPTTQLHTSDTGLPYNLALFVFVLTILSRNHAEWAHSSPHCAVATCSLYSSWTFSHLENTHNCLSLFGWFRLAVCPCSLRLWFARSAVCWCVLYMPSASLSLSLSLSVYLFIIRLPLSVESRFGVRAYSPGELFSRVETSAWCSTLKIHLPIIIPCPALL